MVDQAVSMAIGQCRATNYVRIQANGIGGWEKTGKLANTRDILSSCRRDVSTKKCGVCAISREKAG
ncbi:hypothetical protein L1049_010172 [Liquidambar formosana]|uniref:Uncharacterized protein n=1 Tax=Liquidambar formosana TaxID=63359 RepID=A0AAP0NAY5_LIQFO